VSEIFNNFFIDIAKDRCNAKKVKNRYWDRDYSSTVVV
jgi:hypothetical protein